MTVSEANLYYDPYDALIDADPYPVWKRLRDEAPVYHNERYDFWALTRYDDVLTGLLDWETFSSARGILLEAIDTSDEFDPEVGLEGIPPMMIMMDPPRHDRLRKLVGRAFTPRRVGLLEDRVRELCADFLDPHRGGDTFDYMAECGSKVPAIMIGALMGVPIEEQDEVRRQIDLMMRYEEELTTDKLDGIGFLSRYIQQLVNARRKEPADDMISDLLAVEAEVDDDGATSPLTNDEVVGFANLLIAAGTETTARLIGWSLVLLARHPEQRRILLDDPGVLPNAIDELLRYEAPSPIQSRYVTRDFERHGVTIPAGARVALLNGSADRDERHFPDADRFDVRRKIDRHLAFGYGLHFCIGAALARLEGRIVLEETLARFPDWEVDESSVQLVRTSTVRGPESLQFHG
ncbi:MAG TPA: cytochrome P450 [Acidimicrobiia bacterium]|jgi:cytochrome P450